MTPIGYIEDALGDINPEALDFLVASGLFVGLRAWNDSTAETLRLFTRRHGRLVLNIQKEAVT